MASSRNPRVATFDYSKPPKVEEDIQAGFGLDNNQYEHLKSHSLEVCLRVNPTQMSYQTGVSRLTEAAHIAEFYNAFPSLCEVPDAWKEWAITKIFIDTRSSNMRPFQASKRQHSPSPDPSDSQGSGRQPKRSRSNTVPVLLPTAPTHPNTKLNMVNLCSPQGDVVIQLLASTLTGHDGQLSWAYLVGEAEAYRDQIEFPFDQRLYLLHRPNQHLAIRTQRSLQSALHELGPSAVAVFAANRPEIHTPPTPLPLECDNIETDDTPASNGAFRPTNGSGLSQNQSSSPEKSADKTHRLPSDHSNHSQPATPRPTRRQQATDASKLPESAPVPTPQSQRRREIFIISDDDDESADDKPKWKQEVQARKEGRREEKEDFPEEEDDEGDDEKTTKELARIAQARFQALLTAKTADALHARIGTTMEHCSRAEWTEAAEFWGITLEMFETHQIIRLPHQWDLKTLFTPYQLTEAYILYKKELSTDNGGIFANMMGMGKTRTMLLMILIGHAHLANWTEVRYDRQNHITTRHRTTKDATVRCPTAQDRTFRCLCEEDASMPEDPRLAPTIVTGWGRAVDAWRSEIDTMGLLKSKWCKKGDPLALRFCVIDKENTDDQVKPPTANEETEMRIDPCIDRRVARKNKDVRPRKFTKEGREQEETVLWAVEEQNRPAVHPAATADRPAPSAGRFVILCRYTTIQKRVFQKFPKMSIQLSRTITKNGTPFVEHTTLDISSWVTIWGRTIFDEFHNCKSENTLMGNFYRSLRKHNHYYQWKSWAMSGTPMEKGLHEILIFISLALVGLANRDGCSNWDVLSRRSQADGIDAYVAHNPVYQSIQKIPTGKSQFKGANNGQVMAKAWANMITRAKDGVDGICDSDEYKKLLHTGEAIAERFMLRRTLATRDPWQKKVSGIQGGFLTFFRPCHTPALHEIVRDAEQVCRNTLIQEGASGTKANETVIFRRSEMQAIATYPALATMKATSYKLSGSANTKRFVGEDIQPYFATPDQGPFVQNLEALLASSPKFKQLELECRKVSISTTPGRKGMQSNDGRTHARAEVPAKIVIGSYKPVVQLVTWLGLRKRFGAHNVLLLKGALDETAFEEIMAQWRDPDGPFILVASMAYAEAITWVEANTIIVVEPQDRQNIQDQFLFRIYRLGQLAPLCIGLVLYNPESTLEVDVLGKQLMKTVSRDGIQGGKTVQGTAIDWHTDQDIQLTLEGTV